MAIVEEDPACSGPTIPNLAPVRPRWLFSRGSLTALMVLVCMGAACGDDETKPTPEPEPEPEEATWSVVFDGLPGALLSISALSADDVWVVGGDGGDGPMVLHYDGATWQRLSTGAEGDLWWVHAFDGGPVFMGGTDGKILRYEGGTFESFDTPGDGTVFGIWGPTPDDLWAVGGAGTTPTDGFIWRFDGTTWTEEPAAAALDIASTATLYKVWGRSSTDVYMVGTQGLLLHQTANGIDTLDSGTTRDLFTVHGNDELCVAVGGYGTGTLVEQAGAGFADVTPAAAPQMTGVFLGDDGTGLAAGVRGALMMREEGGWLPIETDFDIIEDFHAAAIDDEGGQWAVGGQVASTPLIQGVLAYRGTAELDGATIEGL